MHAFKEDKIAWTIGGLSIIGLAMGIWSQELFGFGVAAAGLCYAGLRISGWAPHRRQANLHAPGAAAPAIVAQPPAAPADAPLDTQQLVEQMLRQERYALLLRPEIVPNLTQDQFDRALAALQDAMAAVPEGQITVGQFSLPASDKDEEGTSPGRVVRVERYLLDRYPVTNRQYQAFVDAGGYEQMAIWEPDIWPGVLDFVDATGCPGPRFWKNGRHAPGTEDHPVVGVCWYEACAFARWVGKRLPTDPEWEKAGSWPVQMTANKRPQRKYPWGDSMDRRRANLWGSGPAKIVSVREFSGGVSVGGVYQLVGNVWEWTTGSFGAWSFPGGDLVLASPMRSIRGGAYDTYFDNQATCQFQSGEDPVARKHNIGFRCAVSACDLSLYGPRRDETEEQDAIAAEAGPTDDFAVAQEVQT